MNLCENHTSTSQTDGRTDGQTNDLLWHALCVASRGEKDTPLYYPRSLISYDISFIFRGATYRKFMMSNTNGVVKYVRYLCPICHANLVLNEELAIMIVASNSHSEVYI